LHKGVWRPNLLIKGKGRGGKRQRREREGREVKKGRGIRRERKGLAVEGKGKYDTIPLISASLATPMFTGVYRTQSTVLSQTRLRGWSGNGRGMAGKREGREGRDGGKRV